MIELKMDVTKIPKGRIFVGAKGKYLDLRLVPNRHGRDEFGMDGFVAISLSKAAREGGDRGEIVGNWKETANDRRESPATHQPRPQPPAVPDLDSEDDSGIPF